MAIRKELIDELMESYEKPEDLLGEGGLLKDLTKALLEVKSPKFWRRIGDVFQLKFPNNWGQSHVFKDKMKNLPTLLLLLILTLPLCGCEKNLQLGDSVNSFGTYRYPDGVRLIVSDNSGILKYVVENAEGEVIIKTRRRASIYQRWLIAWDGNYLWVGSSDIGDVVWRLDSNSSYQPDYDLLRGSLPLDIIPPKFLDYLSR